MIRIVERKEKEVKIAVDQLNFFYDQTHALKNISMEIKENEVFALIGPSGCGKYDFFTCIK